MAAKLSNDVLCLCRDDGELPPENKLVLVMCSEQTYLAYRDHRNHWHHAATHKELYGVMAWCALSAKDW